MSPAGWFLQDRLVAELGAAAWPVSLGLCSPELGWGSCRQLAQGCLGGKLWLTSTSVVQDAGRQQELLGQCCRCQISPANPAWSSLLSPLRVLEILATLRFTSASQDRQSRPFQACAVWSFLWSCRGFGDRCQWWCRVKLEPSL